MLNIITAPGPPLPPPLGLASTATIPLEALQVDFTPEKEEPVYDPNWCHCTVHRRPCGQLWEILSYNKKTDIIDLQDLGVNYARDGQNANLTDAHKMWS